MTVYVELNQTDSVMDMLVDKIKTTQLDNLRKDLSAEIMQLSMVEYKLKSVFVLLHIIEESRKALAQIEITNFLDTLKKKVAEVSKQTETEKNQLLQMFMQDAKVIEALDDKDHFMARLIGEAKDKIEELESVLSRIVKQRDQLSLPELKKEQ